MPKQRRTKKEKVRTSKRVERQSGFQINEELFTKSEKKAPTTLKTSENKYLKADLTKTLILTMLVLALELALWQYLSRR